MKFMPYCCLGLVSFLSIFGESVEERPISSSSNTKEKAFLRGNESGRRANAVEDNASDRELKPMFCGCPGCDEGAFNAFAGEYKCGDRIHFLRNSGGFSERDACVRVAGTEFPAECGICDPDSCSSSDNNQEPETPPPPPPPSSVKCGCPECDNVWNVMAGDYSCGVRIEWLQSEMFTIAGGPYDESVACSKVGSEEFPDECGKCDPSRCNNADDITTATPTKNPTSTPTRTPTKEPTAEPTMVPTRSPTNTPTRTPTVSPTQSPTKTPTRTPTVSPTQSPTKSPTESPIQSNNNNNDAAVCSCSTCDDSVWNTFAGEYKCGDRIQYLQNFEGFNERDACSRVAGLEFPGKCGGCDPDRCVELQPNFNNNNNNNGPVPTSSPVPLRQKCGGAVNSSGDSNQVCQNDLWNPTGDSTMYCFAYGGSGDPCHLSNTNDPNDGRFKDPSACFGDTLYLWDEPDTQGENYDWAGTTWLDYSRRFSNELRTMRARGTKVTSPMLKAGGPGVLTKNLDDFFNSCGSACTDPSDPAYIGVIAINAFCGDFNGPAGCRGGAAFIYNEAITTSSSFSNIPVYITNWSKLQTSNPQDQVDAINAIEEFFPSSAASNPVVERVYWFGATDFGGGSSNNFLTQMLADGSTLGEIWRNKCETL